MEIQYADFIGVYKNVYPDGFCNHVISKTEEVINSGAGYDRLMGENAPAHKKQDTSINGTQTLCGFTYLNKRLDELFFQGLNICFNEYREKYSILREDKNFTHDMKVQKTGPGEGYHLWHYENCSSSCFSRSVVFMLYLNTVRPENAGETEFLYQQRRIQPTENTMILWPAGYTHTHRGNPVHGNAYKYVITGWFNNSN